MANVTKPSPDIAAVFDSYPEKLKQRLLALRQLIFETADQTHGVGPVTETLKWGQPSYLTSETNRGSTIRIGQHKDADQIALFVHCKTNLIAQFKDYYGDTLTYDGKRAVVFDVNEPLVNDPVCHCISMALTYHLSKRTSEK